jgi:predicted Zn-dependent protease
VIGLALINKARGEYEQAVASLSGLLEQNPRNHRLAIEIAECYLRAGQTAQAIDVLRRFLRAGGRNPSVSDMLRDLQRRGGDRRRAEQP